MKPLERRTLKEAAEIYSKKSSASVFQEEHKRDFIAGAKWQAERMYSEEEVGKAIEAFRDGTKWQQERMYTEKEMLNILVTLFSEPEDAVTYFEQFKKK